MMGITNEFERDLINQAQLKHPGRVDMIAFQNVADAGDGSPGVQRCFRNYLHEGGMEKDLDLLGYGIKGTSVDINNAELQQLSNIGSATIDATQWGYVGGADQPVKIADSPTFGGLILSTGGVITSENEDLTFTFGRASLGSPYADQMFLAHRDQLSQTNYAICQYSDGGTWINSATGKTTNFGINNVSKMNLSTSGLQIGSSGARVTTIENNDALGVSDTKLCTQGNVKAYADLMLPLTGGTMSGNIIMGSDDITFTAGGLVDGVDVDLHDHSGSDKGVAVPFTSLSGDIVYGQLDSIVDTSGVGSANMISVATHQHTDADGSSKIAHVDTTGRTVSDHHTKYTDANARAAAVSDTAFGPSWSGISNIAGSKGALWDEIPRMVNGTYTGDGSTGKQISLGVSKTCRFVMITAYYASDAEGESFLFAFNNDDGFAYKFENDQGYVRDNAIRTMGSSYFYVDDDGIDASPNKIGQVYHYFAICY